ncbi:MAG: FHA domain-containing protein [Lentisphaeria bacterium]|nr:FHA domain-containing protein [Lentisphaeria bacterium]
MQITCQKCNTVIAREDAGPFCPECGAELVSAETAAPEAAHDTVFTPPAAECSFEKNFASSQGIRTFSGSLTEIGQQLAEKIDQVDVTTSVRSDCKALEVAYNQNLFFLCGAESILKLRLKPLISDLKQLVVFMEVIRAGQPSRRQILIHEILKQDKDFTLRIPFNPEQTRGRLTMTFYIGCKVGTNDFDFYEFSVEHKVYDDHQDSSSLSITINQDITATHAADVNNRIISEELTKMAGQDMTVNAMIDSLNDLPPDFVVQRLTKTMWRPGLGSGLQHFADRLLLEYKGKKIYLLSKSSISIGRSTVADPDIWLPNATVSKKQADFIYDEKHVKLVDHSSYGTYLNGNKIQDTEVLLDDNGILEFGDVCMKMRIQKCRGRLQHNICQTCNAPQIKSMTLTRQDLPEYYLCIWECCELGRIIEDLADWTVFARENCFLIRTPAQDFYYLRPGSTFEAKGCKISVKYFPNEK